MVGAAISGGGGPTPGPAEAAQLLSDWIPYLSEGFCGRCSGLLRNRLQNLASGKVEGVPLSPATGESCADVCPADGYNSQHAKIASSTNGHQERFSGSTRPTPSSELSSPLPADGYDSQHAKIASSTNGHQERFSRSTRPTPSSELSSPLPSKSYAENFGSSIRGLDRDFLAAQHEGKKHSSPATAGQASIGHSMSRLSFKDDAVGGLLSELPGLSKEESERSRFLQVGRKKDFSHVERINGRPTNILQGLELHTRVFDASEQKRIVDCVYAFQEMGRAGKLRERTYSEPRKWMRGKGRVTIQFGCCYNYATDKNGNPPGIIRDEEVDPIPPVFKSIIRRLVGWQVLPSTCIPNSCIVNIYDEGDCIPPHIDHHDFLRPFCTISFLCECSIMFGSNLKVAGPGEFSGPVSIPLPVGSVLILNGNGADIARHCVPAVPAKRISITFRKMDDSKLPYKFKPDPDLQGIQPLSFSSSKPSSHQVDSSPILQNLGTPTSTGTQGSSPFALGRDEFPPLGGSSRSNSGHKPGPKSFRPK